MGNAPSMRWFWRRLQVMSPAEIAHRIGQALRNRLPGAQRWPSADGAEVHSVRDSRFLTAAEPQLFRLPMEMDAAASARLLAGKLPCFGRWVLAGTGMFWHSDPHSGAAWPRSGRIDYRPGNPHGDVRVVWEINRLQHLVGLACAGADDPVQRERARELIEAQLLDWWQANPPGQGVNYLSAMEEALRLVSLLHAFDLVRGGPGDPLRAVLAEIVVGHAWHIERHLSLYSSAGNHTVAEAVGLLYAGLLFPECAAAARWQRTASQLLATEAARQVLPDGGGLEQATGYLLFITDLMGLAQALLKHLGKPPVPPLDAAVARARDFLNALAAGPEDLPRIGDSDDGWALSPWLRLSWRNSPPAARQQTFRQAGLTVASFSGHDRLLFLHNPLGMPPSFGHGHADALSVLFTLDGVDLFVDPGTGQYGGDPAQRRYFRGSRAHNTATVDDADQARQLSAFMWGGPYRSTLELAESSPDQLLLLARHDAWQSAGISHWRAVSYRRGRYLAIQDWLIGQAAAPVRVRWHLGCPLVQDADVLSLAVSEHRALPLVMSGGEVRLHLGTRQPLAGWRSPRYGEVVPCHTIEVTLPGKPDRRLLTVVCLDAARADPGSVQADFSKVEVLVSGSSS